MVDPTLDALLKCRGFVRPGDDDDYFARLTQSDSCLMILRDTYIQNGSNSHSQGHPRHLGKIIPEKS